MEGKISEDHILDSLANEKSEANISNQNAENSVHQQSPKIEKEEFSASPTPDKKVLLTIDKTTAEAFTKPLFY